MRTPDRQTSVAVLAELVALANKLQRHDRGEVLIDDATLAGYVARLVELQQQMNAIADREKARVEELTAFRDALTAGQEPSEEDRLRFLSIDEEYEARLSEWPTLRLRARSLSDQLQGIIAERAEARKKGNLGQPGA